ncbi:hypothetical protein AB8O64_34115 [Streptomyces sp. QH1-20]
MRAQHDEGAVPVSTEPRNDRDPWDDVVLDESFVRGAEISEPSARARILTARWRHSTPEPQPWRADAPPAGWFWSKVRRRRWRRS